MTDRPPRDGYVRSDATHIEVTWRFETVGEQPKVGVVTFETADGPVSIGLNRRDAEALIRTLGLFLEDLPPGREPS